jgi:hypothetical protein
MQQSSLPSHVVVVLFLVLGLIACHPKANLSACQHGLIGTGRIWGTMTDDMGVPVVGARIFLTAPSLGGTACTQTDERGFYNFYLLPPGDGYTVTAEAWGFVTNNHQRKQVIAGRSVRLDFYASYGMPNFVQVPQSMINYDDLGATTTLQYSTETKGYQLHLP